MKLLSVQIGVFSQELISRPDLLFEQVNEKMGGIVNEMPTILNLPQDIPSDIPVVQAKSTNGAIMVNVSRARIDLIINFAFKNGETPLETFSSQKSLLQNFYKGVLNTIEANRIGLVITTFKEEKSNAKAVFEKYFSKKYVSKYIEASIRVNKQTMRKSTIYNNIQSVNTAKITVDNEEITGILFQYDINNVSEQGKKINDDIASYIISQGFDTLSPDSIKEMI